MPNKITPAEAVQNAMAEAIARLGARIDAGTTPLNCGNDDDYVYTDEEGTLNGLWIARTFRHNEIVYKARKVNASSGAVKFDLRFAEEDGEAVFNYHVPFRRDTSAEEARAKQSADAKKAAETHKAELVRLANQKKEQDAAAALAAATEKKNKQKRDLALATDWNKLDKKTQQKTNKDNWDKAWLEKNKNRKF